ncbi:MAG: transglutaminase family protein [Alphaproteobacteria bacterium]|nr:transglutaminase family protein [Alphaproteobacteria bacterium]
MRLFISHTTTYRFSQPALHGLQRLRLKPKDTHGQTIRGWDMHFHGARIEVEYEDHHHNATTLVSLEPNAEEVSVTCKGVFDTSDKVGVIGHHAGHMPLWSFLRPTVLTRPGQRVRALVSSVKADRDNRLDFLHALSDTVRDAIKYRPGVTDVDTTAEQALTAGQGVCQDQAQVFISAGRLAGVPMRYVGGYLMMNDRVGQDAGHGWAEAHVEGLGWVGFDVSNGISPDERYVRVASGCDYSEAAPITGVAAGGGQISLHVSVEVREEPPDQRQQQMQQMQQQSAG